MLRIPANELDGVVGGLVRLLRDAGQISDQVGLLDAIDLECAIDAGQRTAARLEAPGTSNRIELLHQIVQRIVVTEQALEIEVRKAALLGQPIQGHDDETMRLIVPVQVKRSGQALRLVICSAEAQRAQGPEPRLIALLAKAQRWFAMLSSRKYPSVLAIANEHGMATSDVTQVIYLAFLAPDIVRRIVDGKHPIGLGTKRLLAMAPLPLDWADQRKALGFSG